MFSESSVLNDAVFVFRWQVHLLVPALFAVLGLWWGITRRPWYVAPTLFLALLWLFVPLEAPEPAVILLMATPVLALVGRLTWWLTQSPAEGPGPDRETTSSRWRWGLRDILWLTFLVGLLIALALQLERFSWGTVANLLGRPTVYWPDIAINAACLIAVAVATLLVFRQRSRSRAMAMGVVLSLSLALAIGVQQFLARTEWLLIPDWGLYVSQSTTTSWRWEWAPTARDILLVYLISFLEFTVVLAAGLFAVLPAKSDTTPRSRFISRGVGTGCLLAATIGLGMVYFQMLNRPEYPPEESLSTTPREQIFAVVAEHEAVNPKSESLDDLRATQGDVVADRVAKLLHELEATLQSGPIAWFDPRTDVADFEHISRSLDNTQRARLVARTLGAQAKADWAAGRRESALRYSMLNLRLGAALQQRGTAVDAFVGHALEGIAMHDLSEWRAELQCEEVSQLMSLLETMADSREAPDLLLRRDLAYTEDAYGWRQGLEGAAHRLLGTPNGIADNWRLFCARRDARLLLLQTDLAIRCYRQRQGTWPGDLNELVPDGLPSPPIDSFSSQPLIYRPDGDGFVLYSVGENRRDDGGRFGTTAGFHQQPNDRDLDLDTWLRTP